MEIQEPLSAKLTGCRIRFSRRQRFNARFMLATFGRQHMAMHATQDSFISALIAFIPATI